MDDPKRQSKLEPLLEELDALVGTWEMEVSAEGQIMSRGEASFEWIEGGKFLVQHINADTALPDTPAEWTDNTPIAVTAIIGLDESSEQFTHLYADSRGVLRVYQMKLDGGDWTMWRDGPEFKQRFSGKISDDGSTISGYWEISNDGVKWERDFDLVYKQKTRQT